MEDIPSIRLLANKTTVSLMFRSVVDFFRCAISALSSESLFCSSFTRSRSWSGSGGSSGERGVILGASNMRKKRTKTLGRKAVCLRIHIGAIKPSG